MSEAKHIIRVTDEALAAVELWAEEQGVPKTEAASQLLLKGHRRVAAWRKHEKKKQRATKKRNGKTR